MTRTKTTAETAIKIKAQPICSSCSACCCRLEVIILSETGVPLRHIETDEWGGQTMARLDDGWCSALDRNSMNCTIYSKRPDICRELEMGGNECKSIRANIL